MNMNHNPSLTWFDRLANEIIFDILDYLSSNDIIYTFFYFNQRFNNLLLSHERYLSNIESPLTNINYWNNIFPIIHLQIQCLVLNTNNFPFQLNFFPNLKSVIISSSFPFDYDELYSLLQNEQFNKLTSFKIQSDIESTNYENILFEKIFNHQCSLKTFKYSSKRSLASFSDNLNLPFNLNLHSLILNVHDFSSAFSLLHHTPNLKALDFLIETPDADDSIQFDLSHIKLEKFSLTFVRSNTNGLYNEQEFIILTNLIQQFSSSLIYLSLNFSNLLTNTMCEYYFNGHRLQYQLLESLIELKQFHFYAKLDEYRSDTTKILLTFENQFWHDHEWTVATDEYYLYTIPFHFDRLKNFTDFEWIKTINCEIIQSPWIWFNVKSIELSKFDLNLIKKLKRKMPKLKLIEFKTMQNPFINLNNINLTLDSITTLHLSKELINYMTPWVINVLPNLKCLILTYPEFSSSRSILNKITGKLKSELEQLTKNSYIYFSNIQEIQIIISDDKFHYENFHEKDILNLFKKFKNLKNLSFNIHCYRTQCCLPEDIKRKFSSNKILNLYKLNYFKNYVQFLKKDF